MSATEPEMRFRWHQKGKTLTSLVTNAATPCNVNDDGYIRAYFHLTLW